LLTRKREKMYTELSFNKKEMWEAPALKKRGKRFLRLSGEKKAGQSCIGKKKAQGWLGRLHFSSRGVFQTLNQCRRGWQKKKGKGGRSHVSEGEGYRSFRRGNSGKKAFLKGGRKGSKHRVLCYSMDSRRRMLPFIEPIKGKRRLEENAGTGFIL